MACVWYIRGVGISRQGYAVGDPGILVEC